MIANSFSAESGVLTITGESDGHKGLASLTLLVEEIASVQYQVSDMHDKLLIFLRGGRFSFELTGVVVKDLASFLDKGMRHITKMRAAQNGER